MTTILTDCECDCCGRVALCARGEVTGIETWACAVCHGYPADEFDDEYDKPERNEHVAEPFRSIVNAFSAPKRA